MTSNKPLTILLAEDNNDHAELMIDTLQEFNNDNNLIHVTNGECVLQYLRKEAQFDTASWKFPDLVLLDIKMPKLDGISTLRTIRSDKKFKALPTVMVSTSRTREEITECFKLGANSYITKPIHFEEFTRKIKELNLY